jgi:hypothetical protein
LRGMSIYKMLFIDHYKIEWKTNQIQLILFVSSNTH